VKFSVLGALALALCFAMRKALRCNVTRNMIGCFFTDAKGYLQKIEKRKTKNPACFSVEIFFEISFLKSGPVHTPYTP
jgi:hypothetical protein